ncbi:MAG: Sec-independent protein translocase protein TatB [Actinomycetota bacterium]
MPQIGPMEIMVVAVIAFFVLGPDKLPGVARQMGRYATELRKMVSEVKDEFRTELRDIKNMDETPAASTSAASGDGAAPKKTQSAATDDGAAPKKTQPAAKDPAPGPSSDSGEPTS